MKVTIELEIDDLGSVLDFLQAQIKTQTPIQKDPPTPPAIPIPKDRIDQVLALKNEGFDVETIADIPKFGLKIPSIKLYKRKGSIIVRIVGLGGIVLWIYI